MPTISFRPMPCFAQSVYGTGPIQYLQVGNYTVFQLGDNFRPSMLIQSEEKKGISTTCMTNLAFSLTIVSKYVKLCKLEVVKSYYCKAYNRFLQFYKSVNMV